MSAVPIVVNCLVRQLFMLDLSCITRGGGAGSREEGRLTRETNLKRSTKCMSSGRGREEKKKEDEEEKAATSPEGDKHNGNFASFKWRQGRRKTGKTERKMLKSSMAGEGRGSRERKGEGE